VLLGGNTKRVGFLGHDKLSTYGIGTEHTRGQWQSIHRQLAARQLVDMDQEGYGVLRLNATSWEILRGQRQVALRSEPDRPGRAGRGVVASGQHGKSSARPGAWERNLKPDDEALFQRLRELRRDIAKEENVPPYAVFPDRTLLEMAACRPRSVEEASCIFGVGRMKLLRYAERFVAIILAHNEAFGLPEDLPPLPERPDREAEARGRALTDTELESVGLLRRLHNVEAVAAERSLSLSTIYKHAIAAIERGELQLSEVVDLDRETMARIQSAFQTCGDVLLRTVYEALEGSVPYDVLRCIRARNQCQAMNSSAESAVASQE